MNDFWSEDLWLPSNLTWNDLKSTSMWVPSNTELWVTLPIAFIIIIIKMLWKQIVSVFLPRYLKLDNFDSKLHVHNEILENYYLKNTKKKFSSPEVKKIADEIVWNVHEVQNWFEMRRGIDHRELIDKFTESSWEFVFYVPAVIYGIYVFSKTNWLTDTRELYEGWPLQYVPLDLYHYYIIEFSFYLACTVLAFFHYQRTDTMMMVLHHVTTLFLMFISYNMNLLRVGALIMFVHDIADPLLHISKMLYYLRQPIIARALFFMFTIVFFLTRLVLFPVKVLHPIFTEGPQIIGYIKLYEYGKVALVLLQIMHLAWFYIIMKHFMKYVWNLDEISGDDREGSENEDEITDEKEINNVSISNGFNASNGVCQSQKTNGFSKLKSS